MRISKWGEYGILCCLYMAKQELSKKKKSLSVGAAELAYSQNIPLQYAQQILQKLRRGGILSSVRGPGGGYALSRASAEITLKDILLAAEGDTFEIICDKNSIFASCSAVERNCSLKKVWHELRMEIDGYLESKSLADLAREELDTSCNTGSDTLVSLSSSKAP